MMHKTRRFGVTKWTREELAERLSENTWTLCTAVQTEGGTIWANDSTSADGAQEYALFRLIKNEWRQVESITVSWCTKEKLLGYAERADLGEFDSGHWDWGLLDAARLDYQHKLCGHCM